MNTKEDTDYTALKRSEVEAAGTVTNIWEYFQRKRDKHTWNSGHCGQSPFRSPPRSGQSSAHSLHLHAEHLQRNFPLGVRNGHSQYCRGSATEGQDFESVQGDKMASQCQFVAEALCPICQDFVADLVILECGHSFCRSCTTQSWDREGRNSCPECREEFADRTVRNNRALASITEKARTLSLNSEEKESKLHCGQHREELKLFCETDEKQACLDCRDEREHESHSLMPIKEAVKIYKNRVKSSIQSLTKNKSAVQEMEEKQRQKISQVREQSQGLESHITSQFAELHQFLEEAGRRRRVSDDAQTLSLREGAVPAENLNLPFWLNAMLREPFVAINQVSVTLDVETAHPWLEVSEDRKGVKWTETWRDLPVTGKRFKRRACVLGAEGFTSGRHYWEAEMVGNRFWNLGVAAESVERKSRVTLSPETGVWSIRRWDEKFDALTSPPSRLPARPIPGRVGVYLSYESGTVSFYDGDTKSHLHTFTGNKFTEKLYPFIGTRDEAQWLRICSGSAPAIATFRELWTQSPEAILFINISQCPATSGISDLSLFDVHIRITLHLLRLNPICTWFAYFLSDLEHAVVLITFHATKSTISFHMVTPSCQDVCAAQVPHLLVNTGTADAADILTRYPRGKWIWGCENEQIPMLEAGIDVGAVAATETQSGMTREMKRRDRKIYLAE
ncbi:E3 ubiquitin-protein ligase TRIM39-like [Rhinoraja longicauda]